MQVTVNGAVDQLPDNATIKDILASRTLREEIVIVLLNGEMTARETWGSLAVKSNDRVEIIRIVGGG